MGAVFAIQVLTGKETIAKEHMKNRITMFNETRIKSIYSLETFTEVINEETDTIDELSITEHDITMHLQKERYRSSINNIRLQLESLDRYSSEQYEIIKEKYKKEINGLKNEMNECAKNAKNIHSVMKGYMLVELRQEDDFMPNDIYHFIKDTPLVVNILSTIAIPTEEMDYYISNLNKLIEPEVIIEIDEVVEDEVIDEQVSDLLHEANKVETTQTEQIKFFEKIDELRLSAVEKTKELIEEKPLDSLLIKVKAFISRKKEIITMPMNMFLDLYNDIEIDSFNRAIKKKDFLNRLQSFVSRRIALE